LRYLKYFVLIWTVGGASLYGYMVFRDYDPWAALLDIGRPAVGFGFIVLLITLVASIFIARPWCRYACPLGAIAGLFGRISPVFIKRDAHTCTLCGLCQQACPMGLPVSTASEIRHTDCNACLECLEVCPSEGALSLAVGTPVSGQRGKLINSLAFGIAALAIFMGSIQVAQFTGFWSVSRKIPTGITVDEIRGSMMLKDISAAYKVPVEEILDAFGLPRDTPPTTRVKDLRSGTFSPGALREWLRNRVSRR
jgi:polyferredoxin